MIKSWWINAVPLGRAIAMLELVEAGSEIECDMAVPVFSGMKERETPSNTTSLVSRDMTWPETVNRVSGVINWLATTIVSIETTCAAYPSSKSGPRGL